MRSTGVETILVGGVVHTVLETVISDVFVEARCPGASSADAVDDAIFRCVDSVLGLISVAVRVGVDVLVEFQNPGVLASLVRLGVHRDGKVGGRGVDYGLGGGRGVHDWLRGRRGIYDRVDGGCGVHDRFGGGGVYNRADGGDYWHTS